MSTIRESDLNLKLIKAEEQAEHVLDAAERTPEKLLDLSSGGTKWKSIHQKLIDLYIEESKRQPLCRNLKPTSQILAKLVRRECLNTLVVNLYPGNEGYSLLLRGRNGCDSETIRLPYEESDLLEYIDDEELPPVLIDLLDKAQANIFYSGCVIVELRDHRRATNSTYDTQYVMLRPTPQTLLCDINSLTNDGHRWTQEDKFNLESQLLLHTNEPLCLDPTPAVFLVTNRLNYEKSKLNTHILKRSVKKFSQAAVNRKRKMAQCPAPKHLRLHDFISRRRDKLKTAPPVNLKVGKTCVDMWREREVALSPPPSIDVDNYAKMLKKPEPTYDNTPVTVEEYTLETERSQGKVYLTRLTIQQRLTDEFYLGELYVDRDLKQGHSKGSICRFPLGTRANVEKYIKQFTEIFTEEGRRSVKITHQVPGQQAIVTYTHAIPSYTPAQTTTAGATTPAQTLLTQAQSLAATISSAATATDSTPSSSAQQPIKLSLQINPPGGLLSPGASVTENATNGGAVTVNQQLTLQPVQNQQQPQQIAHARRISAGLLGNLQRASGSPSPVSTPTGQSAGLPSYTQATAPSTFPQPHLGGMPPLLTSTPQPSSNPTPPQPSIHRPLCNDNLQFGHHSKLPSAYQMGNGSAPPTPTTPTPQGSMDNLLAESTNQVAGTHSVTLPVTQASAGGGVALATNQTGNVQALANLANLQGNINLGNLGLANLPPGLASIQVSLASVCVPGGIAVPVPLSVINSIAGQPTGIIVSSLPGSTATVTTATSSSPSTATNMPPGVTSPPPTFVTMVSGIPGNTSVMASASMSSTSVVTTPSSVLTPSNMVQVPITSLQQIMAANIKPGFRPGAPLPVLQIPGQQPLQLVPTSGLPQARAQLAAQQLQAGQATGQQQSAAAKQGATVLTAQSLSSQGLAQLTGGRAPGQAQTLNPQQLVQLNPAQQQQLQQHLLQQKQLQQIQLQQLNPQAAIAQQQQAQQSSSSKSRNRKRTGPTPPKT